MPREVLTPEQIQAQRLAKKEAKNAMKHGKPASSSGKCIDPTIVAHRLEIIAELEAQRIQAEADLVKSTDRRNEIIRQQNMNASINHADSIERRSEQFADVANRRMRRNAINAGYDDDYLRGM